MFRHFFRLTAFSLIVILTTACLPDDSGGGPSASSEVPVSGEGGNANAVASAMYSFDQELLNRAPVDESKLGQEPVYFFLEPSKAWRDRGISRVNYRCCKGIGGPGLGTPHRPDVVATAEPWSTYFDLSTLEAQSTKEIELEVKFKDGGSEKLRAQFLVRGKSGSAPSNPNAPSAGSGGSNSGSSEPTNSAPTISGSPVEAVTAERNYRFEPQANDPDGDTIAFSISNRPGWADFDSLTGVLAGTPTLNDIGVYDDVAIIVSDGQTSSALGPFRIEVLSNGSGSVTLSWQPPTERTDGAPLSDLVGYRLVFGPQSGVYTDEIDIANAGLTSYVVDNLATGDWYFAIAAYDASGLESDLSGEAFRTVR